MTIAHKTGLVALALAMLVAAMLLPPTVASADDHVDKGAVVLVGTAHLAGGIQPDPAPADGCLGGVAVGAGTGESGAETPVVVAPVASNPNAGASFTYDNSLIGGTANGNLWLDDIQGHNINAGFDWARTGFIALVNLTGNNEVGTAVAGLVPVDVAAFACAGKKKDGSAITHPWSDPPGVHVQIVGVGVITD